MPYNDFLELGVEGGLIAIVLWLLFIIKLFIHNIKTQNSVTPLIAFLVIQLTNFGFQAIPAFALFLFYTALNNFETFKETPALLRNKGVFEKHANLIYYFCLPFFLLITFTFLSRQALWAKAFYKQNIISKTYEGKETIEAYNEIYPLLKRFPSYLEHIGDAYLQNKEYEKAKTQYVSAMEYSSEPGLLLKTGYSYQQQQIYDSSEYYYSVVEHMQSSRLTPKMALLTLFKVKNDKRKMLLKAKEIISLNVNNTDEEGTKIKAFANAIIVQNQ